MTYLKLSEWLKAELDCNVALQIDPNHVKTLNRRGKARRRLEKLKEALVDFNAAKAIEPDNQEILDEIKIITNKINTIKDAQRKRMVLPHPTYSEEKIRVKVKDFDPEPAKKEVEEITEVNKASEKPKQVTAKPKESTVESNKPKGGVGESAVQGSEEPADFLNLKQIDKPVHHHEDEDEESEQTPVKEDVNDLKNSVHFRMDRNQEAFISDIKLKPVVVKPAPKQTILKKNTRRSQLTSDGSNAVHINSKTALPNKEEVIQTSIKMMQNNVIKEADKAQQGQKEQKLIENSSEFIGTWKHIKTNTEASEKFLSNLVKPERIPQIFKEGIEVDLFLELINFMKNDANKNEELCAKMLQAFPKIKRIEIIIKSLISKEKKDVRSLWENVHKSDKVDQTLKDDINTFYSNI
jgi:hypothetical protein